MTGPLEGIRVLEIGNFIAVPYCGMMLADLGADVIKLERISGGDLVRFSGPFVNGESTAFLQLNRNKRSIAVDLGTDSGRQLVRRLSATIDVVMENLRPGAVARMGLGYEALSTVNPGLVYLSASGWGQSGPYAHKPGLDIMAQGMSGLMSITGDEEGEPVKVGVPIADLSCALHGVIATLAALRERERTGRGQHLDVSLFESAVSLAVWEAAKYFSTGEIPRAQGSAHQAAAPYQAIRVKDGFVTIGAATPATWDSLCQAFHLEELAIDARFLTNELRFQHRRELAGELQAMLADVPIAECLARLDACGVPAGPINDYAQVFHDPHLESAGFFVKAAHPTAGTVTHLASPIRFDGHRARTITPAPRLGEHSMEVLQELGVPADEIDELIREGALRGLDADV